MATTKLKKLTRAELKSQIALTQQTLSELEAELDRRDEARQHDGIDQIDEYLEETNQSILNLIDVVRKVLKN